MGADSARVVDLFTQTPEKKVLTATEYNGQTYGRVVSAESVCTIELQLISHTDYIC